MMKVRCGRCATEFEATAGRHPCPACGAVNEVRLPGEISPPDVPPPPPMTVEPAPRVECPECGFSFIVGDVVQAPCPNCRAIVTVASSEGGS